jgi:uncharacterized membrane protein
MKNRTTFLIAGFSLLLLSATACTHDPVGVDTQPVVCFQNEVKPIIQINCAKSGCHDGEAESDMRSDAGIMLYVTPFKPDQSSLYTVTTSTWFNPMPPSPNPALTQQQRTTIAIWILQGANTDCGK